MRNTLYAITLCLSLAACASGESTPIASVPDSNATGATGTPADTAATAGTTTGGTAGSGSGTGTGGGSSGSGLPPAATPPSAGGGTSAFLPSLARIDAANPSDGPIAKFAETYAQNWNFEGHSVDSRFTASQGLWTLDDTTFEPWLFDRTSVAYYLYLRTGDAKWRTLFHQYFTFYRQRIDAAGIFTPKGSGDTKYSYVTPFLLYERDSGDTQYRAIAKRIHDAWVAEFPNAWSPGLGLWTEREIGLALEAAVAYYDLTREPAALARANALVAQWSSLSAATGAPLHTLQQHGEEFSEPWASRMMSSPWMAALYFQAARRLHALTGNTEVLAQASRYADFLDQYGFVDGSAFSASYAGVTVPFYLVGTETFNDGTANVRWYSRETPGEGDMAHCLDVAGLLKFSLQAKQARSEPTARTQQRITELRACAAREFADFTRTTTYLPKYRINPPRKFNWQMRGSVELAY